MYQVRRVTMALCGVILCGFCVGMLQKANLGVDPFTCFVTGIACLAQPIQLFTSS